jgi:hypothetical protein
MKRQFAFLVVPVILTSIAACAQTAKEPFECGDDLRPGIPYSKLAKCYEQQRKTALVITAASSLVWRKNQDDFAALRTAL